MPTMPNLLSHARRMKATSEDQYAKAPRRPRVLADAKAWSGIERVMDHIAHHLGFDPVDVDGSNSMRWQHLLRVAAGGLSAPPFHRCDVPRDIAGKIYNADHSPNGTWYGRGLSARHDGALEGEAASIAPGRQAWVEVERQPASAQTRTGADGPVKFGDSFTLTHSQSARGLVHVYQDGVDPNLNHGGQPRWGKGFVPEGGTGRPCGARFGLDVWAVKITATGYRKGPQDRRPRRRHPDGSEPATWRSSAALPTRSATGWRTHLAGLHHAIPPSCGSRAARSLQATPASSFAAAAQLA